MKKTSILVALLVVAAGITHAQQATSSFPALTGPYLGQKPPGKSAEPFAPDIFTARYSASHTVITFSPDGQMAYWQATEKKASSGDPQRKGIYWSRVENGVWTPPEPTPWTTSADDGPFVSPDGKNLFFISWRSSDKPGRNDWETIWYMDKTPGGWSEPQMILSELNSLRLIHWGISVDSQNNLYFGVRPTMSLLDGYLGDIYCSKFADGHYGKPEKLPSTVNVPGYKFSPFIAPDGSYLIFTHTGSESDHYKLLICFRRQGGDWTEPKEINPIIGVDNELTLNPYISPCGKHLFFDVVKMNSPQLYWVDASFIEDMKKVELEN